MEWVERVERSEIPQAIQDVELRIEAAEELISALCENIREHERILAELKSEYRRAVSVLAKKYLERLDSCE